MPYLEWAVVLLMFAIPLPYRGSNISFHAIAPHIRLYIRGDSMEQLEMSTLFVLLTIAY